MNVSSLQININLIPREEWPAVSRINNLVHEIDWYIDEFEHAVALYDLGAQLYRQPPRSLMPRELFKAINRPTAWMRMACGEAAMLIFHIAKTINAINFKQCPSLGARVDARAMKLARKRIKERFPYYEDVRNAVGHTAELTITDEAFEKNRPDEGPFMKKVITRDGMVMSKYCTTGPEKGAQNIAVRADRATLDELLEIRRILHEAFSAVRFQWPV